MPKMSEHSKRRRFVEAGKLNQFDTKTQKLLEEIDKAQNALEEIRQKTFEEIVVLEQRNKELRKPWHEQRAAYIAQIPNFWVTTLLNHPDINMLLDEEEENCIHHLKKFEVEEFSDVTAGFYLKFGFNDNPYFENDLLVKEYHFGVEPKCVSTNIIWKDGIQPLGQIPDASTNSPAKKRRVDFKSFFKWFRDNTDPFTDDIAEIFKDDIWTNPLQYYLVPDIESNDVGSSPSDSSDTEEPRRIEKSERIISKSSSVRTKTSTSTNAASIPEVSAGSNGISNETRSGDLSGTCDAGVTSESGNDVENEVTTPVSGGTPTGSIPGSVRRRLYMTGDYGF